jgi:predicted ATPase/class 3 adenylate cyclase
MRLAHPAFPQPQKATRVTDESPDVTFVFTDIEGSTRLWELQPERMGPALAAHDALARDAVAQHGGRLVKSTGDGIHAVFDHPLNALRAVLGLQQALADPTATAGVALSVRCGLNLGADERRDGDFFGRAVNRAARIMSAAHGGQTLLSQAVAERLIPLPERVTLRDLGRVRLRDLSTPERVYQVLHPALRSDFPPLRSLEATPNNLAQQLNSFVGREREMGEVKALLAAHRLVMLLGLGGIGKSRLSVQLGAELIGDHPDGVWLIELAPLTDARLVPQALASVLGVKEEAGRPVMEALLKHVRDRQLLVILDNCEHVVHACADLAKQLLQAGPMVKILASSREVLRVAGETVYHLPTLSAPEPGQAVSLHALAQHDAVRLFVERATAAQPAFALSERNVAAVADICHRLDGIPLALELAAARTRAMPVETLAARLSDRFRLLKTSDQTVLPRQRTLRALIDWSYDLLEANERAVFQRLSVFAGGWTLEAAEAVCAGGEVEEVAVLDLLSQLVEKSLVVMDAQGARYRMLETVRQYAHERGAEAGALDDSCVRHLSFYLALAEEARPQLAGPQQGAWLGRLDTERENMLLAHASGKNLAHGGVLGLRLIDALRPYLIYRGLVSLGLQMTQEVLARAGMERRDEVRCKALFGAGQYCNFMGRYEQAMGCLVEALAIARETGNVRWTAGVLQLLGWACHAEGMLDAARNHLEEALVLMRELGDKRDVLGAANQLAQLYRAQGQMDLAQPLYETMLTLARELGHQTNIAVGLLNLAMVSIGRGAHERAAPMLVEVLRIAESIKPTPAAQWAIDVCAGLAVARGDWAGAARFFGFSEAQSAAVGLKRDPADEAFLGPRIARARLALGGGEFDRFESQGRALAPDEAIVAARAWLTGLA